jgi:predicted nuclease of predicted toxin-antitoxin system
MRLLFDQNLSHRLCKALAGDFPDASQVHRLGLAHADDRVVWDFARAHGFTLVSQDSDFAELAALLGPPPQVIWLRCGNQPTAAIAAFRQAPRDHHCLRA